MLCKISLSGLRGNSLRISKEFTRWSARYVFVAERAINQWSSLPDDLVMAANVNSFRNGLDLFWSKYRYILEPFIIQHCVVLYFILSFLPVCNFLLILAA